MPESIDILARLARAGDVAREAGALAASYFGDPARVRVETKGQNDITTAVDREVEELIVARLRETFPEDCFWGEEYGGRHAERLWIIDPIDGTRNYASGRPFYCVSIAFAAGTELLAGVIYHPERDELFAAARGHGATLNGEPLRASGAAAIEGARLASDCPPEVVARCRLLRGQWLEAGALNHRLGAGALAIAHVACGRLDAYWNLAIHTWDVAAAIVLVREAGGQTNDFAVAEGLESGQAVVATAPGLFETVMARTFPGP